MNTIDLKRFSEILRHTQAELKTFLERELASLGYEEIYNENGFLYAPGIGVDGEVLLTAHMDTVHQEIPADIYIEEENILSSPQGIGGDDRCGIYMILEIIKETKCSVLFCEDEEIGCVGSHKFTKSMYLERIKNLRYMVELDRRGSNDLVFYDCDNEQFEDWLIENTGYTTNFGTCSDISELMCASGVAGVNFSCGYYKEHTKDEYIVLDEMERTMNTVKELVKLPSEKFSYVEACYDDYDYGFGKYNCSVWDEFAPLHNHKNTSLLCYVEINFVGENGEEEFEIVRGATYEEAFLEFFYLHPTIPMENVLSVEEV